MTGVNPFVGDEFVKRTVNLGSLFYAAAICLLVGAMGAIFPTSFISSAAPEKGEGHRREEVARSVSCVAMATAMEDNDPFSDGWVADVDIKNPSLRFLLGAAEPEIPRLPRLCIYTAVVEIAPKQGPPSSVVSV